MSFYDLHPDTLMINIAGDSATRLYVPAEKLVAIAVEYGVLIEKDYKGGKYTDVFVDPDNVNLSNCMPKMQFTNAASLRAGIAAQRLEK